MVIFIYSLNNTIIWGELFLERRNKYIILLVVILIVALGIGGVFAYQSYKISQTDKLMLQHHDLAVKANTLSNETNNIFNVTPIDYDKFFTNIDELINNEKEIKAVDESAYQSADGPYKELIALQLKEDTLFLDAFNLWKTKNVYLQKNELYQANQIIKQEENNNNERTKNNNEVSTFLSTHPDVKEYANKHWNYTDEPAA
jgi:hypothetical protein